MRWLVFLKTVFSLIQTWIEQDRERRLLKAGAALEKQKELEHAEDIRKTLDAAKVNLSADAVDELLKRPSDRKSKLQHVPANLSGAYDLPDER